MKRLCFLAGVLSAVAVTFVYDMIEAVQSYDRVHFHE